MGLEHIKFVVFGARLVLAHNETTTIMYDRVENKWSESAYDYRVLEIMDGKEYTELDEEDILEIYGASVITSAKSKFMEIENKNGEN